jgi:hypothetical protein
MKLKPLVLTPAALYSSYVVMSRTIVIKRKGQTT